MRSQLIALTLLAGLVSWAPLSASAQTYHYNASRHHNARTGIIRSIIGNRIMLDNGATVVLHPGTRISPLGTTLQPGMLIRVKGPRTSIGHYDANAVAAARYRNGAFQF